MAELTLRDIIKSQNPDGSMDKFVDPTKVETTAFLDAVAIECNSGVYHEGEVLVTNSTASEYSFGEGTAATKDGYALVTEGTCQVESKAQMDVRLMEKYGSAAAGRYQRLEQNKFKVMMELGADRLFNGSKSSDPRQITGIFNRADYSALGTGYVFDNAGGNASATANKTSIVIIQWGESKCHLIVPRQITNGKTVMRKFTPEVQVADAAGNTYPAQQTRFNMYFGLFIHDPRCVVRVVNISTTNIDGVNDCSFDEDVLVEAYMSMPNNGEGAVIYAPQAIRTQMIKRANSKPNSQFRIENGMDTAFPIPGKILTFMGVPVKREDKISTTGARITA